MSVTDSKTETGVAFDNRNAGLEQAVTGINALAPPGLDTERLTRIREAAQRCETCAKCGGGLTPQETVWRISFAQGPSICGGWMRQVAPVCHQCRPRYRYSPPARPCQQCGRGVVNQGVRSQATHILCSDRCSKPYYNALAKAKRAKPRERECPACGRAFAARGGAKTCSPACRQRAYRHRRGG